MSAEPADLQPAPTPAPLSELTDRELAEVTLTGVREVARMLDKYGPTLDRLQSVFEALDDPPPKLRALSGLLGLKGS